MLHLKFTASKQATLFAKIMANTKYKRRRETARASCRWIFS